MDERKETDAGLGLDDLLDEILQKNMEAAVRDRLRTDEGSASEWSPEAMLDLSLHVDEDEDITRLIEEAVTEEVNAAYGGADAAGTAGLDGVRPGDAVGASGAGGVHLADAAGLDGVRSTGASGVAGAASGDAAGADGSGASSSEAQAASGDAGQGKKKKSSFKFIRDKGKQDDFRVIEVEMGSEEDKRITSKDVFSMLLYVAVILLLTILIVQFVGQRTRVSGSSMESTLSDGDNLIIDKISYRFHEPERFDIVIFPYRHTEDTYYIKRIIGLPGETVQIDNKGGIWINGYALSENYGQEPIDNPGLAAEPLLLGEDEYFVLGDNRNNSSDSRFAGVGAIQREDIIGKAWMRIYPFDEIERVE